MEILLLLFVQISLQWIFQCVFNERMFFPLRFEYHLLYLGLEQFHEYFVGGKFMMHHFDLLLPHEFLL